jgi:hypothetical protein
LFHVLLLSVIQNVEWLQVSEFERSVERIFTIETGSVEPEDLERLSMTTERLTEDIRTLPATTELARKLFPEFRDPGPRAPLPEKKPAPRYPEEELPVTAYTDLSERSQAFVRDGERHVLDPGEERIRYLSSGRPVGPAPTPEPPPAPRLSDDPGGLLRAIRGERTRFADAGTAPRLALPPPSGEGAPVEGQPVSLDRDAEGLFVDKGPGTPLKPLPLDVKIDVFAEPGSPYRFFRLTLTEGKERKLPVIPKNVLFVVDISATISRTMLAKTRDAVASAAAGLNRGDAFNVIRFSEQTYRAFKGFVPPTPENVRRAAASIHREHGQVQTDVYTALKGVIADLPKEGRKARRPTNVYLISDGNPTTGIKEIRKIVNDISDVTQSHYSIFAVNPGSPAGNQYLLDLLAYRSRGVFAQARRVEDADATLLALLMQYKSPLLMNLRAQYGNFEVDEVYPQTLPNFYRGQPLVIYGRCRPGDEIAVRIIGDSATDRRKFLYTTRLPDVRTDDPTIAREWARGKIHYLVSRIAREGETKEHRDEIRRLSKRYRLASPYR